LAVTSFTYRIAPNVPGAAIIFGNRRVVNFIDDIHLILHSVPFPKTE